MGKEMVAGKSLAQLHEELVSLRTAQAGTTNAEECAILQTGSAQLELDIQEKKVQELDEKKDLFLVVSGVVFFSVGILSSSFVSFMPTFLWPALALQVLVYSVSCVMAFRIWEKLDNAKRQFKLQKQKLLNE